MLNRLLGEINTKVLDRGRGLFSLQAWLALGSWTLDSFLAPNSGVGHENLSLVTWAGTWSLVPNSELNFVAIFNILTLQGPRCQCLAPVPSGRWTDDSFLEFATNFLTIFSTRTEIKALAAHRLPMSAGCYWAVHCYNGLAVLMAPAPVAPDEGCWRTVLCSEGTEWLWAGHGLRRRGLCCVMSRQQTHYT